MGKENDSLIYRLKITLYGFVVESYNNYDHD